jgi:hypothetical protein
MLRKLVIPAMLFLSVGAYADDSSSSNIWGDKGLIGIEVGYVGTDYTKKTLFNPSGNEETASSASIGLKLGGESKHYRFFVEGQYWNTDNDYEGAVTVGAALQYLIRLNEHFNIFLGVNGGSINSYGSEWDPYAGGDAGVNFDLNDAFGIEVGGRYCGVGTSDDLKVKDFYQGYVSAIFKFTGDY